MPRGKKRVTQSGADAQTAKSVVGQRYGEGKEQQELINAMPAPDLASEAPSMGNGATMDPRMPVGPQSAPRAVGDPDQLSAFLGANKPSLLSGSQRPDQPVTDGLSFGPGRGPEALGAARARAPIARYLENLSNESGNPKWRRLAERAGLV